MGGELDIATAPKLARALEDLAISAHEIVIGLERVWFIDAVALRRLLRAQERLLARGSRLALTGASPPIARAVELTGLSSAFTFVASADEVFCNDAA